MEEKHWQLQQAGVFESYRQVHRAYAHLASEKGNLEALKRALFIQWYSVAEPSCFTGIFDIYSDGEERQVLEILDGMAACNELDNELRWMLPWYYLIAEWHFDAHNGLYRLKSHLLNDQRTLSKLWDEGEPSEQSLEGRGQMSAYWLSILRNRRQKGSS